MTCAQPRDRIVSALRLQPMTVDQLSRCLSLHRSTVRRHVRAMRYERKLRGVNALSRWGRPWVVYEVRAS